MLVSSKIYTLKPYFQCEDSERWGLWEVIRSWGQKPQEWGLVIQERFLASYEDTVRQWLSVKMQARRWICWCLELELPKALGLWEIGFFFFFLSHSVFSILIYYMLCLKRLKQFPWSIHIPLRKSPRALNGSTDSHLRSCELPFRDRVLVRVLHRLEYLQKSEI